MKILAFSDIHEDEVALESLAKLATEFDHVLICGDTSRNNLFAESMLKAFPNGFLIPGNWEDKKIHDLLSVSPQWLNEKRAELANGLNIVGFGYSNITPFGTYGELTEDEIYERMSKLPIDANTILMLHCPPKGYFDKTSRGENVGSDAVLRIITERNPLVAFFGHVHEHAGIEKLGPTTLVKLPAAKDMRACSVTLEDKKIKTEFISL